MFGGQILFKVTSGQKPKRYDHDIFKVEVMDAVTLGIQICHSKRENPFGSKVILGEQPCKYETLENAHKFGISKTNSGFNLQIDGVFS